MGPDKANTILDALVERYPPGYPRSSAYLDSGPGTAYFRRFGALHARSLLYKQVELTGLETQLNELDKKDAQTNGKEDDTTWRLGHSISLNNGYMNEERRDLMQKIDQKMKEYGMQPHSMCCSMSILTGVDELLLRDAQLLRFSRPSRRNYLNFMDYFYTEKPFSEKEEGFVFHQQDFVALEESEDSWLDSVMHKAMGHCRKGLLRVRARSLRGQQEY